MTSELCYLQEAASHDSIIEEINAEAFGPGRFVRTASRIREQGPHDMALSFVCLDQDQVIASVRMTPVWAGKAAGHMLGPLAVRPTHKNRGIGRHLVRIAVEAAEKAGSQTVILIGDAPYYSPLGFRPIVPPTLKLPGPVDPRRILAHPIVEGVETKMIGMMRWRG
ncbi:GNAT family N-acetyltransferase [Martelella mediterranea]|uniref:Putative N-acetyltransferase YhbS n=1 Tax=Martelella mediterranea TaxID=293089 RepID=A0A4R3P5F3_9HYPH|nr:N-acetyltransferase [Martelella mediterranea]TCT44892.1 putative N-acetyltransferase YhbS [Martelella mediterranea]